jgi:heptose I phosphotransferase
VAASYLRDDIAALWSQRDALSEAQALDGEVFREVARRKTMKVEIAGRAFFVKLHHGVGWWEIVKNWLVLKRPVLGARNEFEACRHLEKMNIVAPRVAAFGESDGLPATRFSFILCDALDDYEDLEELTKRWFDAPPSALETRHWVMAVAQFARRFHAAGVVHRDFYLCHLLARRDDPNAPLGVLDLHRALIFDEVPERWRLRDLAALLFSTLDLGINRRAWLRFVRVYTGRPLREVFAEEGEFWQAVYRRACDLYEKGRRKKLVKGNFES